jgi:YidC/Oxa1 family membrane protein insertase
MIETFLVKPIFNLLTLIYALVPGRDLGVAIVLFTLLGRVLMWPLVKKQLHHAKAMRALQPDLKRIKQQTKGDKQKESVMVMALYKEKEINPFSTIGILVLQLPVLLALYAGLRRIILDPQSVIDFSYGFVRELPAMKDLATNVAEKFDPSFFGIADLTKHAIGDTGLYAPATIMAVAAAIVQYYQSKQLTVTSDNERSLRQIFKDTAAGKQVDQSEVSSAMNRNMRLIIPVFMLIITLTIASGLTLYILVGGVIAYIQQAYVLRQDTQELQAQVGDEPVVAEVIAHPKSDNNQKQKKYPTAPATKRKKVRNKRR